jgi:predicted nucleotidyltransferase
MPNLFNLDFIEFIELLNKYKVKYIVVGGYAVILNGYIRSTGDIDLWVEKSEENYKNLEKVYSDFYAPIFSIEEFLSSTVDVWGIGVEPVKIEILTNVDGLIFYDSYINASFYNTGIIEVPYICYDDLIKNKKATGRYKDLADIEQLNKNKKS